MRSLGTERRSTKGCPIAELRVTLFRFNSFKDSWPNSLLCIGKGLIQRIGKLKSMQREDINPEAYVPPDRTSAPDRTSDCSVQCGTATALSAAAACTAASVLCECVRTLQGSKNLMGSVRESCSHK